MRVIHTIAKFRVERNNCEDCSFLLTNRTGGYIWLSDSPASRYQGVFFVEDSKLYRVIENIGVKGSVNELVNKFWCVERKKGNANERFFMPYGHNCIVYENESNQPIELALDVKESYVNNTQALYSIEKESENETVIKCQIKDSVFYITIKSDGICKINSKPFERYYSYDEKRKSLPFSRKVYGAAEINSHLLVITFSKNKNACIKEADFIFKNVEKLKKKQLTELMKIVSQRAKDNEVNMAYNCAKIMLYNMAVNETGIYAGLPWFFQFWARDELTCLKAIKTVKGMENLKEKIFDRWLINAKIGGRMSANINLEGKENGSSADAFGFLFKRISDVKVSNQRKSIMSKIADVSTEPLINDSFETWMDSIPRKGERVELQASRLSMFNSMHNITGNNIYKIKEDILRKEVRKKFFNGAILFDSPHDSTIRPNIFLACYIYQDLLSEQEWTLCFENALKRLWCEWVNGGGLSSVDKTTPFFTDTYSGEDNKSYHNGDSWFWINNLAAVVLWKINKKKFSEFIKKILYANTAEILWMGAVGHHSEISSAKQLSSCGCISQAWSAAMFIEMIDEIASDKSFI